LSDGNPTSS